ncbi:Cellulase-like protein 7 [Elsinoe fawcettii]|nr:Cellulase-like protein 7 [Elsinoe fawcettii]
MLTKNLFLGLTALAGLVTANPLYKRQRQFKFNFEDKVRGVNLGGWLLLEPWITPSFFDSEPDWVVDEYTLSQHLGRDEYLRRLQPHWENFIRPEDLDQIAGAGMNHVRIPVGYWSVIPRQGDPYIDGAYPYLGRVLDWANDRGLKVMIDLHGVQGSQNGFDNSGQRGDVRFGQGNSIEEAREVLRKIRYDGTFTRGSETSSYIGSCDGKREGTVAALSDADKSNIRGFINAQLDAYEKRTGWIFWTWKTESSPEWDMQELLQNGIFPSPVTSRNAAGCS